ncbi:MAG: hypothetical protein KJO43_06840, partial [Phycisphaerae bacterium]|nr:hypothetical protein [Phycisphaerae bacterium]
WVGVLGLAVYVLTMGPLYAQTAFRRWLFANAPATLIAAFMPGLLAIAWLIVVAPWLEAGVRRFSDRRPPRRRARLCRIFALIPPVVFALLLVQFAIVRWRNIDDFGWFDHGYGWWVVAALVLSFFYARIMARNLDRRVRAAAAAQQVCFRCNYRLTNLTSGRCPECGERCEPAQA